MCDLCHTVRVVFILYYGGNNITGNFYGTIYTCIPSGLTTLRSDLGKCARLAALITGLEGNCESVTIYPPFHE